MKKSTICILSRALLILTPLFLISPPACAENSSASLQVGVICPLTGAFADVGDAFKNSFILADKNLDREQETDFMFEDDGFDPKKTVLAFNKLTASGRTDAIVVFGSGTALAVADLAERRRIPLLAVSMSDKVVLNRHYVYRFFLTVSAQARIIADEIAKRAYLHIAIVSSQQEATLQLRDLVRRQTGAEIVFNEELAPGETDTRTLATRIKGLNPDAVFLAVLPPQLSAMARQLRQLEYRGELFSAVHAQNAAEVRAAAGSMEGLWFSTFDDSGAAELYENYRRTFGREALPDGALGYDIAALLITRPRPGSLMQYLDGIREFKGVFGKYDFSEARTMTPRVSVKVVQGSGFSRPGR